MYFYAIGQSNHSLKDTGLSKAKELYPGGKKRERESMLASVTPQISDQASPKPGVSTALFQALFWALRRSEDEERSLLLGGPQSSGAATQAGRLYFRGRNKIVGPQRTRVCRGRLLGQLCWEGGQEGDSRAGCGGMNGHLKKEEDWVWWVGTLSRHCEGVGLGRGLLGSIGGLEVLRSRVCVGVGDRKQD